MELEMHSGKKQKFAYDAIRNSYRRKCERSQEGNQMGVP